MPGWAYIRPLLGDHRLRVVVLAIASTAAGLAEAGILGLLSETAAVLVSGASRLHVTIGPLQGRVSISLVLGLAALLALFRLGLQGVLATIPARIASELQVKLRGELFAAFTHASWAEQSRDREGQMQEVATNLVVAAAGGALQATVLIISLTSFVVLVVSALVLNVFAALAVLVAALGLFALMRPLSELGQRYSRELASTSLDYAGGVGEAVRLAEETHVFGVGDAQRERVGLLVEAARRPVFRTQFMLRLVPGLYQSLIYLLIVVALAALYFGGARHVASLGAVVLILVRAGSYGQQVQGAYQFVKQTLPFVDSVEEVRERFANSSPDFGSRKLREVTAIEFEHVSYAYEAGRPILQDVSFSVLRNETIGIVGPTGAGKSTLVQILLGLREPSSGRYLVNGVVAREYQREDWAREISFLSQQPRLLHASVAENIRFFRPLDDEAVERAARLAGIHDEIVRWKNGYDTIVGPRADAVSGGQQQRICLARALAARPRVLVLDEPTSALDPHTELGIQRSLTTLQGGLTLFIVAHRMSTLDICERVMVVVDGRLQGFDSVTALERESAYYRSAVSVRHESAPAADAPSG